MTDKLEKVREEIAKYLYEEAGRVGRLDLWEGSEIKMMCRRQAKDILSIPLEVEPERECPECPRVINDENAIVVAPEYCRYCKLTGTLPACKGTGVLPAKVKTIGEILEKEL